MNTAEQQTDPKLGFSIVKCKRCGKIGRRADMYTEDPKCKEYFCNEAECAEEYEIWVW